MGIVLAAACKTHKGVLFYTAGNGSNALFVHQSSFGLQSMEHCNVARLRPAQQEYAMLPQTRGSD